MITNLHIKNFFSFKDCNIDLHPKVNILVGINGSGKSNLLKAFLFLKKTNSSEFKNFIYKILGGKPRIWFIGSDQHYSTISVRIIAHPNKQEEQLINYIGELILDFSYEYIEEINLINSTDAKSVKHSIKKDQSKLMSDENINEIEFDNWDIPIISKYNYVRDEVDYDIISNTSDVFRGIKLYSQFDTSPNSKLRGTSLPTGDRILDGDGSNLPQILNTLKINDKKSFNLIIEQLQRINPNYKSIDFNHLANNIELMLEESKFNKSVHVSQVSDGTLKFLCLMAIFYNPNRGSVICIDEPETGLHPDMLVAVADGIKYASETSQMIISTHSPLLLNCFELENVRIFEKDEENATVVKQLDKEEYESWSSDYTLGELWTTGHIGGNRW